MDHLKAHGRRAASSWGRPGSKALKRQANKATRVMAGDFEVEPPYAVRFITPEQVGELVNLYHLARTALCTLPLQQQTPWHRMTWAADEFSRANPETTSTGAYKDLCGLLDR